MVCLPLKRRLRNEYLHSSARVLINLALGLRKSSISCSSLCSVYMIKGGIRMLGVYREELLNERGVVQAKNVQDQDVLD